MALQDDSQIHCPRGSMESNQSLFDDVPVAARAVLPNLSQAVYICERSANN